MEKASAIPEAPPSYEATTGQPLYPQAGAGGFEVPPMDNKGLPPGPYGGAPGYPAAGPPAGAYIPPPPQQVVVVVNPPAFGPDPIEMTCSNCQSQIRTSTVSEPGPMAWIIGGVLCIVGLWPCACIPCCIDSLNSVTHKCPNCKCFLGKYKGGL